MIVADTSALITIAGVELLEAVLAEFDVHTTETVIHELEDTSAYEDRHGMAAQTVLDQQQHLTVHETDAATISSSRVDAGEATTIELTNTADVAFLITDDLRALPELQTLVRAEVAISPLLLKALVTRGIIDEQAAIAKLDEVAANWDWFDAPIYRRAKTLFE